MSYINPEILTWARERVGMSIEELASKTKRPIEEVEMWESGEKVPAYGKLEDMAYKYYKVPIAVFFFPYPPQIEDPVNRFRKLPDFEFERFSPDTYKKIRLAQTYQDSLVDVLHGNESEKSIIRKFSGITKTPQKLAKKVRKFLGVSFEEQFDFRSSDTAFKRWRYALEQVGVFTFKDTFKDRFISGFCLVDDDYPLVMINNSNAFTRQIFTLIHELGHILLGVDGITEVDETFFDFLSNSELKTEIYCNQFASEFLVPSDEFKNDIELFQQEGMDAISEIAENYSVSREVILRRLLDNNIISKSKYFEKSGEWNKDYLRRSKGAGGGNYYLTKISYLGESFTKYAFIQNQKGSFSRSQLASHLNVKVKNLGKLEASVRW